MNRVVFLFGCLLACAVDWSIASDASSKWNDFGLSQDAANGNATLFSMKQNNDIFKRLEALSDVTMTDYEFLPVETEEGVVTGVVYEGAKIWLSVPYAKPPIGDLRWADPVPAEPYSTPRDATSVGPTCVQSQGPGISYSTEFSGQEDCLYLNIIAPLAAPSPEKYPRGYPVFVFIHGGDYLTGSGNDDLGAGFPYAQQDIVFVTINYRLNIFGFLQIDTETDANFGAKDQRQALAWLKANIAKFGGNPDKVTISGQSAGASSVMYHIVSPQSAGYFQRAILMSYPSILPHNPTPINARDYWISAVIGAGCNQQMGGAPAILECLRSLGTGDLNKAEFDTLTALFVDVAFASFKFGDMLLYYPVVNAQGDLPLQPFDAINSGQINKVPMIMGTVSGDGNAEVPFFSHSSNCLSRSAYKYWLQAYTTGKLPDVVDENHADSIKLSKRAQKIYNNYPCTSKSCERTTCTAEKDASKFIVENVADYQYFCPLRTVLGGLEKHVHRDAVPVYRYLVTFTKFSVNCFGSTVCSLVSCHGSDKGIAFNEYCSTPNNQEQTATTQLVAAFTNFVHTGNPNSGPRAKTVSVKWPRYSRVEKQFMLIGNSIKLLSVQSLNTFGNKKKVCDMWEEFGFGYN